MGNYYVKFGHFSGKNHVKLGNFVNFSGKCHKNSGIIFDNFSGKNYIKFGHFVNFSQTFFGQKCRGPLKLTELLRLWWMSTACAFITKKCYAIFILARVTYWAYVYFILHKNKRVDFEKARLVVWRTRRQTVSQSDTAVRKCSRITDGLSTPTEHP